ncbi:Hypothetical protein NTJ_15855 [Nesidiocoris tenuis]|uniref:Uncharacterized protein n=1 Tax=Nesidiocoris tenuis TaxID=355587 RepID=A0ABN7BI18_9HEMI|nr:Hypothetical protein NTJ_15855 [Nesidiocoris tenuis]
MTAQHDHSTDSPRGGTDHLLRPARRAVAARRERSTDTMRPANRHITYRWYLLQRTPNGRALVADGRHPKTARMNCAAREPPTGGGSGVEDRVSAASLSRFDRRLLATPVRSGGSGFFPAGEKISPRGRES